MSGDDQWRIGVHEERAPFESESQNARVWTEDWVERWMFRPKCGAQSLSRYGNNNPAADFRCDACSEDCELKSQRAKFGAKVLDGAYSTMSKKVVEKKNPSLLLLQYDRKDLLVSNLTVVPKHFLL